MRDKNISINKEVNYLPWHHLSWLPIRFRLIGRWSDCPDATGH